LPHDGVKYWFCGRGLWVRLDLGSVPFAKGGSNMTSGTGARAMALVLGAFLTSAATPGALGQDRLDLPRAVCGTSDDEYGGRGLTGGNAWTGGLVYYQFAPAITAEQRQQFLDAIAQIAGVSGVQFFERTNQANHVYIEYSTTSDASFSSAIGMTGTRQFLRIWPAHFGMPGILIHEMLHALGHYHEQQRTDRNSFVSVIVANVNPSFLGNYNLQNGTLQGLYDYDSIMHYDAFGFAIRGTAMRVVSPNHRHWQWRLGQYNGIGGTPHISTGDRRALVARYGGPVAPPALFAAHTPALGAGVGTNWSPSFAWNSSADATGYRLEVDDDPYFRTPEIDVTQGAGQLTYDQGELLPADRVFFWRVTATNGVGETVCYPIPRRVFYTGVVPATLHVDATAPPGGGGATWASAMRDLAVACELAASGAPVTQIRVAQGVYEPDSGSGDRTATFWLAPNCAIQGGYAGLGGADPDLRDWRAFPSVLSGDLAGDDGPDFANNSENSYSVVSGGRAGAAVLEGFTIRGGNANGSSFGRRNGGALFAHEGGGTLRDCVFSGNFAFSRGGAICLFESSMSIDRCVFVGNDAGYGGAMFAYTCSPVVTNCVFAGNGSSTTTWAGGAGVLISAGRFVNCTFFGNQANESSGGLDIYQECNVQVSNCVFWGNTAPAGPSMSVNFGGGVAACTVVVRNSLLAGGEAQVPRSGVDTLTFAGVFDAEPWFADAAGGDFRLVRPSPCIDRGNNTLLSGGLVLDAAGSERFVDDPETSDLGVGGGAGGTRIIDVGAFEFVPPACDPDVNCDGSPDQGDVACMILAVAGDISCICQDPDFNQDGSADQGDVAAIIGVVAGASCP